MKTCKKCKMKIANNAKTCKYCGKVVASTSKKMITKNASTTKANKTLQKQANSIIKSDMTSPKIKMTKQEKYNETQRIRTLTKNEIMKQIKAKKKKAIEEEQKSFLENTKKHVIKNKKKSNNFKNKILKTIKEINKNIEKKTNFKNESSKKLKEAKKNNKKKVKEKKLEDNKQKETTVEKKLDINEEINKEESSKKQIIIDRIFNKYTLIIFIFLLLGITIFICGISLFEADYSLKVDEYGKEFHMNQSIRFDGITYNITNIKEVESTQYKKPKEGNRFVMVTIKMENYSKNKVKYSYRNWKMLNSDGEESARIFTPVNANTALYSGNLVVGGSKYGTLVFEEPKDDNNLYLQFYRLVPKETEDGIKEVLDEELGVIFKVKLNPIAN